MVALEGFEGVVQDVQLTSGELLRTTPGSATVARSPVPLPCLPAVSVALAIILKGAKAYNFLLAQFIVKALILGSRWIQFPRDILQVIEH